MIHYLTEVKSDQVKDILYYTKVKNFDLRIVPNLKGITPLHLCVKDSQTLLATQLLNHLAGMPLEDHSKFIQDLLPDLLKLCPLAIADYLDARLVKVPWTPAFSDGKLKHQAGCDFAVLPLNLFPVNEQKMKEELFDGSGRNQDLKMPTSIVLSDISELHLFQNEIGKQFMQQLSLVKHSANIYSKRFIQGLIEVKWPPIRRALMLQLFLPYVIYLALFNFYALYLVYEKDDVFLQTLTFAV